MIHLFLIEVSNVDRRKNFDWEGHNERKIKLNISSNPFLVNFCVQQNTELYLIFFLATKFLKQLSYAFHKIVRLKTWVLLYHSSIKPESK